MKLTDSLVIVILAGATALAQNPAATLGVAKNAAQTASHPSAATPAPAKAPSPTASKMPVQSSAKPPATSNKPSTPATTAAKAPVTTTAPVAATKAPVATAKAPVVKEKPAAAEKKSTPFMPKKAVAAKKEKVATPASAKEEQTESRVSAVKPANKRDPFVSPIVRASGGGPLCETGKRCLVVDQLILRGIVKSPSGYIAVVENAAKRAYFLRENDPVFNGSVAKITGDTVTFREQTMDKLGKQGTREVVKKVNAPVV
jgi:hypothetical protein